ncbi:hypothetical protein BGW39_007516 [Mortierella sp. 14UC]|nr:hypothetical protein BGW39_007516 [Mortierella sp. 14UC]
MASHIHDNNTNNSTNNPPVAGIPGLGSFRGFFADDTDNKVAKFLNVPLDMSRNAGVLLSRPSPGMVFTDNNFLSVFLGVPKKFDFEQDMNERNCLDCNIFMPASALNSNEELPVLVWVHAAPLHRYEFSNLVLASVELNKPMTVVALNYRLNCLGFLSSKELFLDAQEYTKSITTGQQRDWHDASAGNWGLLDQILGLGWIRDYIGTFSGNPNCVTAMSESGGAVALSYLQFIPQARGLFKRMIFQSGAASMIPQMLPDQDGRVVFDRLCRLCGVPEDLAPFEKVVRLRQVPAEKLAVEHMTATPFILFRPTMDGVLLSEIVEVLLRMLRVMTLNWRTMMVAQLGAITLAEYEPFIARLCAPQDRETFTCLYATPAPKPDADVQAISTRIVDNYGFRFPTHQLSEAILVHPRAPNSLDTISTAIQKRLNPWLLEWPRVME